MFFEVGVLENFTIFTGKHLYWSLFLVILQVFKPAADVQACNFIKKRLQLKGFTVNIVQFLKTAFLLEYLWWLLL